MKGGKILISSSRRKVPSGKKELEHPVLQSHLLWGAIRMQGVPKEIFMGIINHMFWFLMINEKEFQS